MNGIGQTSLILNSANVNLKCWLTAHTVRVTQQTVNNFRHTLLGVVNARLGDFFFFPFRSSPQVTTLCHGDMSQVEHTLTHPHTQYALSLAQYSAACV